MTTQTGRKKPAPAATDARSSRVEKRRGRKAACHLPTRTLTVDRWKD